LPTGASGYLVLAGVVAFANIASPELPQMPIVADVLLGLGALAVVLAGALALLGVARAPSARGLERG
jgi:hypothetical protein